MSIITNNNKASNEVFVSDVEDSEVTLKPKVKKATKKVPVSPMSPTPSVGSKNKAELKMLTVEETEDLLNLEEDDDFSKGNKLYLGETKLTTEKLRELFGEPEELVWEDKEFMDKRFCYRISIGKKRFVLFDLIDEDEDQEWDNLDEIEWFAMGDGGLRTLNSLMKRTGDMGMESESVE
jgi:hypothetical protein